jgi:hypothetical protein
MVPSVKKWWIETCRFCRIIDRILCVSLRVLIVLLSLYGGYLIVAWWQDVSPVVEFYSGDVSSSTVRPNEILIFYQPFKKNRNCWGTVRRVLIGECGFFIISESPSWIHAPWEGRLTYPVQIPSEAIPGECGFQIFARFVCNPLDFIEPRLVASAPIRFRVLRYDQ